MAAHIVGSSTPGLIRVHERVVFDVISDRGFVGATLNAARVCCQVGGALRGVRECQSCPRFVELSDDSIGLRVRCRWSDRDLVRDCMSSAGALVLTSPKTPCSEASALAERHGVRHLLVHDGIWFVGVASAREMKCRGATPVGEIMATEVFALAASATLGEAAAAMVKLGLRMMPVVSRGFLVGVLSHGDLLRIGVHPELLGHQRRQPRTLIEAHELLLAKK
jgi:hypothetical protein